MASTNVKYSLKVQIDQSKVVQFSKQNYKFCFASGVAGDENADPSFNIVADTQEMGMDLTVEWTEKYAIGASNSTFKNGVKFNASTGKPVPIGFGQSYTQTPVFVPGIVNADASAPKSGFNFINQAKAASAVVYKWVQGSWAPIYISAAAPLGPGTETLIPKVVCAIWFSVAAETANMVSSYSTTPLIIDLTNNSTGSAVVSFDKDGAWKVISN